MLKSASQNKTNIYVTRWLKTYNICICRNPFFRLLHYPCHRPLLPLVESILVMSLIENNTVVSFDRLSIVWLYIVSMLSSRIYLRWTTIPHLHSCKTCLSSYISAFIQPTTN